MRQAQLLENRAQPRDLVVQIRISQASGAEDQDFLLGHNRRRDRYEVNRVHSALPLFQSRRSSSSPSRSGKSRPPQTASLSSAVRSRTTRAKERARARGEPNPPREPLRRPYLQVTRLGRQSNGP